MIQSGITKPQLKSPQASGCICQWHRGDGWERDFDPFNDPCTANHDPLSKAANKASNGHERSRADYYRRRREIAALVAESKEDDATTEVRTTQEHETIPIWTEEAILDRLDAARVVNLSLRRLTEREEQLVRLTYGIGNYAEEQPEEIGKRLGLSRGRVWQIRQKAERKLRYPNKSEEDNYDEKLGKKLRYLRTYPMGQTAGRDCVVSSYRFAVKLRKLRGLQALPKHEWVVEEKPVRKYNRSAPTCWNFSTGHFDAPDPLTGHIPARYTTLDRIPWEEGYVRASEVVEKPGNKRPPPHNRLQQSKPGGGFFRRVIGGMLDIVNRQQS